MSNDKKSKRNFLQTIRMPMLISSAIAILVLCFVVYRWSQSSQTFLQQQFSAQYNQGLANTGAAFLGSLIDNGDLESIKAVGHKLSEQPTIQKLSIYRRNGELIYQAGTLDSPHSNPVIANIDHEDSYNGYLIIYFVTPDSLSKQDRVIWLSPYMVWGFGALVWSILFIFLTAKPAKKNNHKAQAGTLKSANTAEQNSQLLKALLRRNKKNNNHNLDGSIVIKAQWSKLSIEDNTRLLRVLSRWLPQNALIATQFSQGLLVLGLSSEQSPIKRNPLHALLNCLNQLQLEPKMIVHRLDFGQDIYQVVFDIIEPGIWFEKRLIETANHYNWPTQKTIDIELDDHTVIELCQLKQPDAEQRGLIERQVRFLMDD